MRQLLDQALDDRDIGLADRGGDGKRRRQRRLRVRLGRGDGEVRFGGSRMLELRLGGPEIPARGGVQVGRGGSRLAGHRAGIEIGGRRSGVPVDARLRVLEARAEIGMRRRAGGCGRGRRGARHGRGRKIAQRRHRRGDCLPGGGALRRIELRRIGRHRAGQRRRRRHLAAGARQDHRLEPRDLLVQLGDDLRVAPLAVEAREPQIQHDAADGRRPAGEARLDVECQPHGERDHDHGDADDGISGRGALRDGTRHVGGAHVAHFSGDSLDMIRD